jgi:hypothetical protein
MAEGGFLEVLMDQIREFSKTVAYEASQLDQDSPADRQKMAHLNKDAAEFASKVKEIKSNFESTVATLEGEFED